MNELLIRLMTAAKSLRNYRELLTLRDGDLAPSRKPSWGRRVHAAIVVFQKMTHDKK